MVRSLTQHKSTHSKMTNPGNDGTSAPLPSTHPTTASTGCVAAARHHPTPASAPLAKRPRCAVIHRDENATNTLAQNDDDDDDDDDDDVCPPHPDVDSNLAAAPSSDQQQCVHPIPEPPSQPYSPLLPSLPLQDHAPLQSPMHDATCLSLSSPNHLQPPLSSSLPAYGVLPRPAVAAAADRTLIASFVHRHPTPHHAVTSTTPPTRRPRPEGVRIHTLPRRHHICHGHHQSGCCHCRCRCSYPCDVVIDDDDGGSQGASIVQAMQTQPRPLGPSFLSSGGGQISATVREYLVSWQADLCFCCAMRKHTLAVAVRLLDELLALGGVCLSRAYVIATACLFIASKLEEVGPVSVRTFAAMIHVAYVRSATKRMKQKQKQTNAQLNRNMNKDAHINVDDDGDVEIVGGDNGYNPAEAVHKTVISMSKFPFSIERLANNMANQQLRHQQQLQRQQLLLLQRQQKQQQQQQLSNNGPQRQPPAYKIPPSKPVYTVSAPISKQPPRPPRLRSQPGAAPSSSSTAAMNSPTHPSVTVSTVNATAAAAGSATMVPSGGGMVTTSGRSIPLSQPEPRCVMLRAQAVKTATETARKDTATGTGTGTGSASGVGVQNSNAVTTTNAAVVREKMAKGILLAERYVLDKLGYNVTKQTALGIVEWIAEQAVKCYGCCLIDEDDDYEDEDDEDEDDDAAKDTTTTPSSSISLLSPFSTSSPSPFISQSESHLQPQPHPQPRPHCKLQSQSHSQCCHPHHEVSGTGTNNAPTKAEDDDSNQFGNRVATDAQFAVMVGLLDAKVAELSGAAIAVGAVRVALCVNGKNGAGIARWANVKGVASAVAALVTAWHHVEAYSDEQRKSIAVLEKAETEVKGFRSRDNALRTLVDRVHEELEAWHPADNDGTNVNGDECGRCENGEEKRSSKGRRKRKWECKRFCHCCCCRSRYRSATVEKNGNGNVGSIDRQMMVSVSPCTDNDNDNNDRRKEEEVVDDMEAKDAMGGDRAMKKRAVKKGGTNDKAGAKSGCDGGAEGVVAHKRKRGQR